MTADTEALEHHPLQPFLPENSRLLMLGSFPPPRKRWSMDFFYPNVQNDMWRIYALIFFGDKNYFYDAVNKKFRQSDIELFLKEKGIALFDTAVSVCRLKGNASDRFLQIAERTDLKALLKRIPRCKAVAATGGKAAGELCDALGLKMPAVGNYTEVESLGIRLYRMPSSSRSYPLALDRKAAFYRAMLQREGFLPEAMPQVPKADAANDKAKADNRKS